MADIATTFDIGGGASAGLSALQFVQNLLTGARTAVIQVENYSSLTLNYSGRNSDDAGHGGLVVYPATTIESGKANTFGAQNLGGSIATGTEGWVQYSGTWVPISPGDPAYQSVIFFTIMWDNPYVGSNSADATLVGSQASIFKVRFAPGHGNTGGQFLYRLYDYTQIAGPPIAPI